MKNAVYDTCYELLISYRRRDAAVAVYVENLAKSLVRNVFRDVNEHVAGYDWRRFWRAALQKEPEPHRNPGIGPLVAVLVTPEVANLREQDEVIREIIEALNNHLETPVALLEFDATATKVLIAELTRLDPIAGQKLSEAHRISLHDFPATDPASATTEQRAVLYNGLHRAARPALRRRLLEQRDRTLEWARGLLQNFLCQDVDLSEQTGTSFVDLELSSRAFVGAGGLGKSIRLARALIKAVENSQTIIVPVLVASEELHSGVHGLSEALGFLGDGDEELDFQIGWCEEHLQVKIVFILDGLERSPRPDAAAAVLGDTASACRFWISCRPEAWSDYFAPVLKWAEGLVVRSTPIDAVSAAALLGVASEIVAARPFLAQPVFIDIALRMRREGQLDTGALTLSGTLTETSLIALFREWAVKDEPGDAHQNLKVSCVELLVELAAKQTGFGAFLVPASQLTALAGNLSTAKAMIARLVRERRYLVEHRVEGELAYRLRHDVLDGAAVAEQLASLSDGVSRLYDGLASGFGQIVAGQWVQRCEDVGENALIEAFFDRFLLFVDNKNYADERGSWNPTTWGAGFVVQQKLPAFASLIAEVLEAKSTAQAKQNGTSFSRRARPARISFGALSSVGSMLRGAGDEGLCDPDGRLRRALARHIRSPKVKYKARLIEGLGRLRDKTGSARRAVKELELLLSKLRGDPLAAGFVAEALAHTRDWRALDVLDRMVAEMDRRRTIDGDAAGTHAISIREVIERRNQMAERMSAPAMPPPPLKLEEVEIALRLYGRRRSEVSDWVAWRRYSDKLARTQEGRCLITQEPIIIEWLARGRWHDHAQTRRDAILALCDLDHDDAFYALLEASVWERVNTIEDAVFAGLRRHAQRWRTDNRGEWAAMHIAQAGARRAAAGKDNRAREFAAAVRAAGGEAKKIVTAGAMELGAFATSEHTLLSWRAPDPDVARVIAAAQCDPGVEHEPKFALESTKVDGGRLQAKLRRITWSEAACFHKGLLKLLAPPPLLARGEFGGDEAAAKAQDGAIAAHVRETLLAMRRGTESLEGRAHAPAIISVHVALVTPKGKVVVVRRSAKSHFYPRKWSVSFEEQVRHEELAGRSPFLTAALRGIGEEFAAPEVGSIELLGQALAFERETQGFFVMLVLRAADDLCERLVQSTKAQEIENACIMPLSDLAAGASEIDNWHPTSAARWLLAAQTT